MVILTKCLLLFWPVSSFFHGEAGGGGWGLMSLLGIIYGRKLDSSPHFPRGWWVRRVSAGHHRQSFNSVLRVSGIFWERQRWGKFRKRNSHTWLWNFPWAGWAVAGCQHRHLRGRAKILACGLLRCLWGEQVIPSLEARFYLGLLETRGIISLTEYLPGEKMTERTNRCVLTESSSGRFSDGLWVPGSLFTF